MPTNSTGFPPTEFSHKYSLVMTPEALANSAQQDPTPPEGLAQPAQALWLAKAGRWHDSHELSQKIPDPVGAWIHAYLHREEGDLSNANYWYARANRSAPPADTSLKDEWQAIAQELL